MTTTPIEQELEKILHLSGCEQRTAGYNDHIDKKDVDVSGISPPFLLIDLEDMEQLEKLTLKEVMQAVTKHTERAVLAELEETLMVITSDETAVDLIKARINRLKTQLEAKDENN